jgi:hypothetical protein
MSLTAAGMPAFVIEAAFVVIFSAPVWLAAKVVGADHPSLLRSILSLFVGTVLAAVAVGVAGPLALLLVPLAFLLAFKFVLGTSFLGAIVLGLAALAGYAAMLHLIGKGLTSG